MPHAPGMPEGRAVAARLDLTNCHGFMARPFMNSARGVRRSWLPEAGVCRAGSDQASHMQDQLVGAGWQAVRGVSRGRPGQAEAPGLLPAGVVPAGRKGRGPGWPCGRL
jgi:hypothetical protein